MKILLGALIVAAFSTPALAKVDDGSDIPACHGVADVCMAASVSAVNSKNGKTIQGYQPGEHNRDGKGLWIDCVGKLAKAQPVEGVSGVSAEAAKACLQGKRALHPSTSAKRK
jgi:hypothetical protein